MKRVLRLFFAISKNIRPSKYIALGCLWTAAATADEAPSPQAIALNCQTCHQSADGATGIPDLSKLNRDELLQALLELKTTPKPGLTIMPRLIKGYSDEQLQAVADFLTEKTR